MRQLKINIDNDNRPLIENGKLYDQSLLSTQYKQAFGAIESVLRAQMQLKNSSFSDDDVEYPNNIIVFDGERGTGKTSCMLSVSQMLLEDGNEPYHDNLLLSETRFARLPMLEPSFFDNEHNVLNLIVSRLYKKYTGLENVSADKRRSILELFSKVQNNLKCMFGKSEKQDALEYLVNLSAAIELKKNLKDLIDIYLGVVGGKPDKLLILIDDIDLNHSQADRMVEEIRKYLILDNCIVLVSVKIEQLSGILFRKYEDEYKDKLLTDEIQIEIQDRVERYLSKLFPQRQRVFMPLPDDYLKSKLIVESSKKLDYKLVDGVTVEESIPDLIFAKTRYLFYNTRKAASPIVPRNLRSIRQILKLLMEMPNYIDGDERSLANKEVFKHYFFNDWIDQNIHPKHKNFVEELIKRDDLTTVNYVVIQHLSELAKMNETISYSKEIGDIATKQNHYYNISLGDVFSMIRKVGSLNFELSIQNLLFFIKSYYSIKLYEAYDTITPDIAPEEVKDTKIYIRRNENSLVKDDYQALVAGSVFNSSIENFHLLFQTVDLKISPDKLIAIVEQIKNEEKEPENQKKLFSLLEFLMLFVSYQESKDTAANHRQMIEKYYSQDIQNTKDLLVCSYGAFIYNLYSYKDAIKRFKSLEQLSPFFDYFEREGNDTLYCRLMNFSQGKREDKTKHKGRESKMLSVCCFRNMEVLEDFYETTSAKTPYLQMSCSALANLFDKASEYFINTYDRHDSIPYTIEFGYFRIFAELLNDTFVQKQLDPLFETINKGNNADGKNENDISAVDATPKELIKNDTGDSQTKSSEDMP